MARIALLEDDEFLRELLAEVLTDRGHEVAEYGDVSSVRAALREGLPDMLITDVGLPDGNGLELVAELRQTYPQAQFPVLVLSGLGAEADFLAGFAAGATDYITKPVSNSELVAKCSLMLSRVRRQASVPDDAEDLPGGGRNAFGRYWIQRKLGQGTGGVVYLATDTKESRDVALKVLSPLSASQDSCRQRFLRESYTLSLVRSPHVVSVLDFGVCEGRPYFAMEWVSGPTLAQQLEVDGPAEEGQVVALLTGLGQALRSLSAAGLVHRDVKPANVVLRNGRYDSPVLVDFGLAKRASDSLLTQQGDILGTPAFMSPECVMGEQIGAQSDLFSLGLLACFACTGRQVFPDRSGLNVMRAIASQPIPLPQVSRPLRQLLKSMTRISLKQRLGSAQELLRSLSEIGTSMAIGAA